MPLVWFVLPCLEVMNRSTGATAALTRCLDIVLNKAVHGAEQQTLASHLSPRGLYQGWPECFSSGHIHAAPSHPLRTFSCDHRSRQSARCLARNRAARAAAAAAAEVVLFEQWQDLVAEQKLRVVSSSGRTWEQERKPTWSAERCCRGHGARQ